MKKLLDKIRNFNYLGYFKGLASKIYHGKESEDEDKSQAEVLEEVANTAPPSKIVLFPFEKCVSKLESESSLGSLIERNRNQKRALPNYSDSVYRVKKKMMLLESNGWKRFEEEYDLLKSLLASLRNIGHEEWDLKVSGLNRHYKLS